jgi:hypothetical protein
MEKKQETELQKVAKKYGAKVSFENTPITNTKGENDISLTVKFTFEDGIYFRSTPYHDKKFGGEVVDVSLRTSVKELQNYMESIGWLMKTIQDDKDNFVEFFNP